MLIGYARTSTLDQMAGFEAQLSELTQGGCQKVFREQVSSVAPRAQLEAALEYIREGDVLVVCKLDRLARSTQHLLEIVDWVKRALTCRSSISVWTPARRLESCC